MITAISFAYELAHNARYPGLESRIEQSLGAPEGRADLSLRSILILASLATIICFRVESPFEEHRRTRRGWLRKVNCDPNYPRCPELVANYFVSQELARLVCTFQWKLIKTGLARRGLVSSPELTTRQQGEFGWFVGPSQTNMGNAAQGEQA